ELLVVERYTTSGLITDNVVQDLAQPLNDIITHAQTLCEEYIGDDNMRHRLNAIMDCVQSARTTLSEVAAGPKAVLRSNRDEKPHADPHLSGKRVLVADDEANIRNTIGEILRRHGCAVEICKDGYEAVSMLEQQEFDLVISDIKMPYRNGYEIFAAARRQNENLPVLLM